MDQPIDGGHRHGPVGEDLVPVSEGLICGDANRTVLIPGADELEQHRRLGLILADVCKVVQNKEIEAIQPVDGGLQRQLAACDLQPLHEVGGTREQDLPAVLQQAQSNGRRQVRLAAPGWPQKNQVGAVAQPAVASAKSRDVCSRHHRHRVEIEVLQRLARQQPGVPKVTFDTAAIALGDLVFGQRHEQARRGPAFRVGPFGER